MQWPSMRLRILHQKLVFLWHLFHPKKSTISVEVFNSLREKNKEPLVVQQCKFMEQVYGTNLSDILSQQVDDDKNLLSLKSAKKILHDADRNYIWE